ncbi:MAG TPA: DinB family protein [Thermoanaerobaculia bacterium]|nr:DinB family protein [Thermoanaerobaculia bacterium]
MRPEQTRVLDYLRAKGTEAPLPELRGHLAATFRKIDALLDSVPPDLRSAPPAPGRWSVHELVDHLVESHRRAVEQLRFLVAGRRPLSAAIPASLQSSAPLERPWDDLVAELRSIHRAFLDLVDGATEETSLDITAPVVMVVKAPQGDGTIPMEWEEELDWKAFTQAFRGHTAEHRAQIERTLSALGAAPGASAA